MRKFFLVSITCFLFSAAWAQNKPDTLQMARDLTGRKNFSEANTLLSAYNSLNANQYGYQLQAQVLYWMQNVESAEALYEKGIERFPDAVELNLDYGRMLFELGRFKKARVQLESVKEKRPDWVEADLLLARMDIWDARPAQGKARALNLLKQYPDNQQAKDILQMSSDATPLTLKMGYGQHQDDQPLNVDMYDAELSWLKSGFFSPHIKYTKQNFSFDGGTSASSWVRMENTVRLNYSKTQWKFGAGLFKSGENQQLSAMLQLTQKLSKSISFNARIQQSPYQYTLASVAGTISQQTLSTGIEYNKGDKWIGSANYILQAFPDGNKSSNAYAWLLMPLVHTKAFGLQTGFSTGIANSDFNTFQSLESAADLAGQYPINSQIPGVFAPYFTPSNQQVNAVLGSLRLGLSKNITFYTRGSIGVFSTTDNPVLVLQQSGSQYLVSQSFSEQSYRPVEFEASLLTSLSNRLMLTTAYRYNSLFFYQSNSGNLQLSYRF